MTLSQASQTYTLLTVAELAEQGLVGRARHACLGNQKTGSRRDDQRRNLAYQPVADSKQCVGLGGLRECQVLLGDADDDAADDIDEGDQQTGYGVAADELGGAVHGAEKCALVLELLTPLPRLGLFDEAGGEIGVDRHLFAGHRIEAEPGRDLGDAPGSLGDDDEVHEHQYAEDDDADDEIAAHDEIAECLDDLSRGSRTFVTMGEDEAGGSKIER